MRSLKIVLAVVAILAMAGTTFAAISFDTVANAPLSSPSLTSWTVRSYGTMAFENVHISATPGGPTDGVVSQANMIFGPVPTATPYKDDFFGMPGPQAADTHFLFNAADILIGVGAVVETNNGANPAGFAPSPPFTYGLGTFGGDLAFTFKSDSAVQGRDFMQVVLPRWSGVWIVGTAVDFATDQKVGFSFFVPEPGTIALLIAGALCLVVTRFRKK